MNQAYLSVMFSKLKVGYNLIDSSNFEPMSLEDSMISLKDGSTMMAGFEGWPSKMIAHVCKALLIGETRTMST